MINASKIKIFFSINVEDLLNMIESRNELIGYVMYPYFIHKHRRKMAKNVLVRTEARYD